MRITTAPPIICGDFPRDALDEAIEVLLEAENLPRMSLDVDGLRAWAGVPSDVPESEVRSPADRGETAGE